MNLNKAINCIKQYNLLMIIIAVLVLSGQVSSEFVFKRKPGNRPANIEGKIINGPFSFKIENFSFSIDQEGQNGCRIKLMYNSNNDFYLTSIEKKTDDLILKDNITYAYVGKDAPLILINLLLKEFKDLHPICQRKAEAKTFDDFIKLISEYKNDVEEIDDIKSFGMPINRFKCSYNNSFFTNNSLKSFRKILMNPQEIYTEMKGDGKFFSKSPNSIDEFNNKNEHHLNSFIIDIKENLARKVIPNLFLWNKQDKKISNRNLHNVIDEFSFTSVDYSKIESSRLTDSSMLSMIYSESESDKSQETETRPDKSLIKNGKNEEINEEITLVPLIEEYESLNKKDLTDVSSMVLPSHTNQHQSGEENLTTNIHFEITNMTTVVTSNHKQAKVVDTLSEQTNIFDKEGPQIKIQEPETLIVEDIDEDVDDIDDKIEPLLNKDANIASIDELFNNMTSSTPSNETIWNGYNELIKQNEQKSFKELNSFLEDWKKLETNDYIPISEKIKMLYDEDNLYAMKVNKTNFENNNIYYYEIDDSDFNYDLSETTSLGEFSAENEENVYLMIGEESSSPNSWNENILFKEMMNKITNLVNDLKNELTQTMNDEEYYKLYKSVIEESNEEINIQFEKYLYKNKYNVMTEYILKYLDEDFDAKLSLNTTVFIQNELVEDQFYSIFQSKLNQKFNSLKENHEMIIAKFITSLTELLNSSYKYIMVGDEKSCVNSKKINPKCFYFHFKRKIEMDQHKKFIKRIVSEEMKEAILNKFLEYLVEFSKTDNNLEKKIMAGDSIAIKNFLFVINLLNIKKFSNYEFYCPIKMFNWETHKRMLLV